MVDLLLIFIIFIFKQKEMKLKNYEIFPNAPITEALLDIKVQLQEGVTLDDLKELHPKLKARFPEINEQRVFSAQLKVGKEPAYSSGPNLALGYLFRSQEEKKVVQYRLNGFTFNKLKPYGSWSALKSEAKELWEPYLEKVKPIKILRIALRYINRIEAPLPMKHFNEYILTNPEIAPKLPQQVSHFLMRIELPNEEIPATAMITMTMERPGKSKKLPLIFDIDVFHQVEYKKNTDKIWNDFEELRNFKNDIFFNSITDKTKELFR
jgi:uncharacterized protein (TIGR04255 family)